MNKDRYKQLLADNKTISIATYGGGWFRNSKTEILINFSFYHARVFGNYSSRPEKRIHLNTFLLEKMVIEIPAIHIKDEVIILANADIYDYALTYKLLVNSDSRLIEVKILDYPEIGEKLITKQETEGIAIRY